MPQQIASALALCAFAVAVSAGLLTSIDAGTILMRALVASMAAYAIGRALGAALAAALNEHLTATTASNPIPDTVRLHAPAPQIGGDVDIIPDVGNR